MIGYLVRENVSRAGARNHRFDGGKIDYVCTGVHWLANGIIESQDTYVMLHSKTLCGTLPLGRYRETGTVGPAFQAPGPVTSSEGLAGSGDLALLTT